MFFLLTLKSWNPLVLIDSTAFDCSYGSPKVAESGGETGSFFCILVKFPRSEALGEGRVETTVLPFWISQ